VYKLNRRVTIHRYTSVKNAFGGLSAMETGNWTKWAEVQERQGTPLNDYQQSQWSYDAVIVMRYETERQLRSNDVIEYENEFYKINSIKIKVEGAKDWEYVQATKLDENINSNAPMDLNSIQVYNYQGIGGETSINVNAIIGRHTFNVFKDGVQYVIINFGSAVDKQVLVNTTTGDITFAQPIETGEFISILYY
jgi:SPP1 family predicted phage head-tail adaptor